MPSAVCRRWIDRTVWRSVNQIAKRPATLANEFADWVYSTVRTAVPHAGVVIATEVPNAAVVIATAEPNAVVVIATAVWCCCHSYNSTKC